jgi:hypothetical protein
MAANVNEVRGGGCFVVAFDVALDAEDIAIAYYNSFSPWHNANAIQ